MPRAMLDAAGVHASDPFGKAACALWGDILRWSVGDVTEYDRKTRRERTVDHVLDVCYLRRGKRVSLVLMQSDAPEVFEQAIEQLTARMAERRNAKLPPEAPPPGAPAKDPCEEFFDAAAFGDLPKLGTLLKAKPELVRATGEFGMTVLHAIATEGSAKIAEFLIKNGADVHARDDRGHTPAHIAQSPALVRVLVRHGADVNARAKDDSTPLHIQAAEGEDTGCIPVIRALLAAGADPALKDDAGHTPAWYAEQRGETKKVTLLRKK